MYPVRIAGRFVAISFIAVCPPFRFCSGEQQCLGTLVQFLVYSIDLFDRTFAIYELHEYPEITWTATVPECGRIFVYGRQLNKRYNHSPQPCSSLQSLHSFQPSQRSDAWRQRFELEHLNTSDPVHATQPYIKPKHVYSSRLWGISSKAYILHPNGCQTDYSKSFFIGRDSALQTHHGNFLLIANKHTKLFDIKQPKDCKFMPKMHRNTLEPGPDGKA